MLKGFVVLELNSNHLKITNNEEREKKSCNGMHDSDYVMTCTTAIYFHIEHAKYVVVTVRFALII